MREFFPQRQRLALMLCLLCVVAGARWGFIDRHGTDLPEWDQWDAECLDLIAWKSGSYQIKSLFVPHAEHHIVLTRATFLGLALANGQWDQRVEGTFNAMLAGLVACLVFYGERYALGEPSAIRQFTCWALIAGAYALPISWQNVLHGFHSQQQFLVGLSLLGIYCVMGNRDGTRYWWLGVAALTLTLGTMASGCFAAGVILFVEAVLCINRAERFRERCPTLGVSSLIVGLGLFTQIHVVAHEPLRARDLHDFFLTLFRQIGWPLFEVTGWVSIAIWLPCTSLAWRLVRLRNPRLVAVSVGTAVGLWVLLQMVAASYARGVAGLPPPSRYLDTLVLGLIANGAAFLILPGGRGPGYRRAVIGAAVLWLVAVAAGVAWHQRFVVGPEVRANDQYYKHCDENVRNYLASGDGIFLRPGEIPYPRTDVLRQRLDNPYVRALLPLSVRMPIRLLGSDSWGHSMVVAPQTRDWRRFGLSGSGDNLLQFSAGDAIRAWGFHQAVGGRLAFHWASFPVRTAVKHGELAFPLAAALTNGEAAFRLERPGSPGILLAKGPKIAWQFAFIRDTEANLRQLAVMAQGKGVVGFGDPIEIGPLSALAIKCGHLGKWLCSGGMLAGLLVSLVGGLGRYRSGRLAVS